MAYCTTVPCNWSKVGRAKRPIRCDQALRRATATEPHSPKAPSALGHVTAICHAVHRYAAPKAACGCKPKKVETRGSRLCRIWSQSQRGQTENICPQFFFLRPRRPPVPLFSLSSPHSITASPPPVNLFLSCLGACQSSLVSFFLVPAVHGATLFTCRKPFVRCSLRSSRLLKSSVEGAKRFNSSPPSLHCQPACVVDSPRRPPLSLALSSCSLSIYPEYISKAFIRILLGTTLPPDCIAASLPDRNNTSTFFFARPTSQSCTLQPDFD